MRGFYQVDGCRGGGEMEWSEMQALRRFVHLSLSGLLAVLSPPSLSGIFLPFYVILILFSRLYASSPALP